MARRTLAAYSTRDNTADDMNDEEEKENELDSPDGQHILENCRLDDQNLDDCLSASSLLSVLIQQWKYVTVIVVLLSAIISGYVYAVQKDDMLYEPEHDKPEHDILKLLKPMSEKLVSQENDTWFQIFTGLTNLVSSPVSPAVYLLVSDETSEKACSCVAEMITTVANKIYPKKDTWLFLNGTELSKSKSTDPGILLESVSDKMQSSKVVLISDIQKIPGNLAAGFHFLVDQENPKIRDAVYIFTMKLEKKNGISKLLDSVEKVLHKSWRDLGTNVLYPLVTRVTEVVLRIARENDIGECSLKTRQTLEIKIP